MKNLTSVERNGVWSVSCVQHGFLENMNFMDSDSYRIPSTSGVEINVALASFKSNGERVFIDAVDWPYNVGCNGRKKGQYLSVN